MLDCEGSLITVEPIRSLSEMEPSGVSVEVTKSCTNKDHCQSGPGLSPFCSKVTNGPWPEPMKSNVWASGRALGTVRFSSVNKVKRGQELGKIMYMGPKGSARARSVPKSRTGPGLSQ